MEVLGSVSIAANVMQVAGYASTIAERLKSNFSRVERIPRRVEGIASRLPQLADAAKQAQVYADDVRTAEPEQWELLEVLKSCNDRLQELEKIVPRAFTSPDAVLLSQKLVTSLEDDEEVKHITSRLEAHLRTLYSFARRRALQTSNGEASVRDVPDFEKIEKEYVEQLQAVEEMNRSSVHWAATTTERYNLDYQDLNPSVQRQVDKPEGLLGTGRYGTVRRIRLSLRSGVSIPLAKKTIRQYGQGLARIKEEILIAQKLEGRPHIVRTIGAYKKTYEDGEDLFNILIFPVADCDLEQFLIRCEEVNTAVQPLSNEPWQQLMKAGALDLTRERNAEYRGALPDSLQWFLRTCLGCMTQAIAWIHGAQIAHHDLKPANVLLRNGRLYVTDFGLCKDRSKEQRSWTEQAGLGTKGWQAREIREEVEQSPFRADVFSLGCIFMHIATVIYFGRPRSKCSAVLESECSVREALIKDYLHPPRDDRGNFILRQGRRGAPDHLRELIAFMLKDNRYDRPEISDVNDWLYMTGHTGVGDHALYHGRCCPSPKHCPHFSGRNRLWRDRIKQYALVEDSEDFEAQLSLLEKLETSPDKWSGSGESFDVNYDDISFEVREQLRISSTRVGSGASSAVSGVVCHGIRMTSSRIWNTFQAEHQRNNEMIALWRKIQGHRHITKLVGTYWTNEHLSTSYHILRVPWADCDLNELLDKCQDMWSTGWPTKSSSDIARVLDVSTATPRDVTAFLKRLMGCVADTLNWIHKREIMHGDLKPNNILLHRGNVFVNDFNLSHDRSGSESEYTEMNYGHTHGYAAPEVVNGETHSPLKSDIYSLGCTYLHIVSAMAGVSRKHCWNILKTRHLRQIEIGRHLHVLMHPSTETSERGEGSANIGYKLSTGLSKLIEDMLRDDPDQRPRIREVNKRLRDMGGEECAYHSECCAQAEGSNPDN